MFRYRVLGLLQSGAARHGYWLAKEYAFRTGTDRNPGQFYRELKNLQESGLIEPVARGGKNGGDPRRVSYRITPAGLIAFDEWFSDVPPASIYSDGEVEARALFFTEVGREKVAQVLESWTVDLSLLTQSLEVDLGRRLALRSTGPDPHTVLLKRRLRHVAADRTFIDELYQEFGIHRPEGGSTAQETSSVLSKLG